MAIAGYNPNQSTWGAPPPSAAVQAPAPPPAWMTPSTSTTTYSGGSVPGAQGAPPPVIPPFPGGQQAYVNPADALAQLQQIIQPPPMIVPPQVQAAQIQVPGGSYDAYRDSLYQSQFAPVQRELTRQAGIADDNVAGMMAQAGLADSGAGVDQRMDTQREYDQRIGDASMDISAAATAATEQARFNILTANAQLQQQASLANAGFDYQSQVANAQNILTGNTAIASGYLQALGISGQQASTWTSAYLNYFSEAERNKILKDQAAQQFHGEWLNYLMQKEKLAADITFQDQQISLQQQELKQQEQLAQMEIEQRDRAMAAESTIQQQQLQNQRLTAGADLALQTNEMPAIASAFQMLMNPNFGTMQQQTPSMPFSEWYNSPAAKIAPITSGAAFASPQLRSVYGF